MTPRSFTDRSDPSSKDSIEPVRSQVSIHPPGNLFVTARNYDRILLKDLLWCSSRLSLYLLLRRIEFNNNYSILVCRLNASPLFQIVLSVTLLQLSIPAQL